MNFQNNISEVTEETFLANPSCRSMITEFNTLSRKFISLLFHDAVSSVQVMCNLKKKVIYNYGKYDI
jgi:hypothetical protein